MLKRWFIGGIVLALVGLPIAQPPSVRAADAEGPAAVVRIKSIDGLVSDALYLAKLVGKEEEAKQGEGLFRAMVPSDETAGIDTKRPLGFYGSVSEDVQNSPAIVLIPITGDKAFIDFLERYNVDAKKGEDGVYTLSTSLAPIPVEIYCRLHDKYAYITAKNKANLAKDKLLDAAKVLGGSRDAIVSASFHVDRVPRGLKQVGLGFMDLGINQQLKFPPTATKAQKDLIRESVKAVSTRVGSFVKEGTSVDFFVDIDRKAGELVLETTIRAAKGSRLANDIADLAQAKSLFAGMVTGAEAFGLLAHVVAPDNIRQILGPVTDEAFQKILANEKDANARGLGERFFKSLGPTIKAGELDMFSRMFGPYKQNQYTTLNGVKVVEGQGIEDTVRAIVAALPPEAKEHIKLDAETVGDAKVHRLDFEAQYDPAVKQLVGSNPIYVTIRPNMVLTALGADGLKVLKEALAAQPAAGPMFQLQASMARLAPGIAQLTSGRGDKNAAEHIEKAAKEAFASAKTEDQIRVTVEGGANLKTKVSIKASVLAFLGRLAPQAAQ